MSKSQPLRGQGCSWDGEGGTSVVDIEVEGDASFDANKQLYADPESASDVAGLGEDAFYNGLNDWVVFKQNGKEYEVRVQTIDDPSRKKQAVVELATLAAGRLS